MVLYSIVDLISAADMLNEFTAARTSSTIAFTDRYNAIDPSSSTAKAEFDAIVAEQATYLASSNATLDEVVGKYNTIVNNLSPSDTELAKQYDTVVNANIKNGIAANNDNIAATNAAEIKIKAAAESPPSPVPPPNPAATLPQSAAKSSSQPAPTSKISNATPNISNAAPKIVQSGQQNVLNGYRSYTYNFTLAALKKTSINNPAEYMKSTQDLVILKSGGKGSSGLVDTGVTRSYTETTTENTAAKTVGGKKQAATSTSSSKIVNWQDYSGTALVAGFNKNSPGRFDMFINNVDIESTMGFSEASSTSLATKLTFDVIEPYSINGFIEALHVSAVAAGYPSYLQASFLLKMEFVGYPDTEKFSTSERIPKSDRYFVFAFTGLEVDVTEQGTKYRCSAVPYNERSFGNPNVLKESISMAGKTVKDILENLFKNINAQVVKADDALKTSQPGKHDKYEIKFQEVLGDNTSENAISKCALNKITRENTLFKFPDAATYKQPPTKDPVIVTYNSIAAVENQVQFSDGANINACIASLIRDSEYVRALLKDVAEDKPGVIDEFGMIKYFIIHINVTNDDVINEATKKPFQTFTYVVTPYLVHYSRTPLYGTQKIEPSKLKNLSLRDYNYIYTGKNTDVIKFNLNFNTLYFEAVPYALGHNDTPGAKLGAGPSSATAPVGKTVTQTGQIPATPVKVAASATEVVQADVNAGQALDDPYDALAKNMHNAIIDSKSPGMLTGEIEIIGDPFFLVTGGTSNHNSKLNGPGQTVDGEAAHNHGQVLITINFRNPIDIDTFARGGSMIFDTKKVPFSGIFMVTQAYSSFKDGKFTQRLQILRIPGQIENNDTPSNPADVITNEADPLDQIIVDTTNANAPSIRPTESTLISQLGSTVPSAGLPGILSKFISATGGLGGTIDGIVTQVTSLIAGAATTPAAFASKLGNNASQLSGLSTNLQSTLIGKADALIKTIPINVDLSLASAQGIAVDSIPTAQLASLPAIAPYAFAPEPAVDQQFLASIATSGPQAIANAFGVKNIASIPGGMLSGDAAAKLLSSAPSGLTNPFAGSTIDTGGSLASAVTSQLGSVSKLTSPLAKIISNTGNV